MIMGRTKQDKQYCRTLQYGTSCYIFCRSVAESVASCRQKRGKAERTNEPRKWSVQLKLQLNAMFRGHGR